MKKKFIKQIALCLLAIFTTTACTDDFETINTDPVAISLAVYDPNYTLTQAQLTYTGSTDFAYETWRANLIYSATMIQGFSTVINYWAGDKYLLNEAYTAAYWERAFAEQVKPVVDAVESTRGKDKYKNLHQVARIWKALIMERLTDLYGDVPYFNAGMGYYSGVLYPAYDKQSEIYADLLKEIEEATAALDPAGDVVKGDVIYGGSIEKWKRFGNTLLLRVAMRLTKVDPETAKIYVAKVQGKTMTSNGDNAFLKHDDLGGRATANRNSQVLLGDGGPEQYYTKWTDTFINLLKSTADPRLSKIAVTQLYSADTDKTPNPAPNSNPADQKGQPNGKDLSGVPGRTIGSDPSFTSFEDYSSPSPYLTNAKGPTFILTYAESELLLADAAQRWSIGTAVDHYNAGVKAAITYLSQYDAAAAVSEVDADNYLVDNPYDATDGLEMINTQFWIHTNTMLNFYESWSNWRRSGFPALTPVVYPGNATGGTIPRRFPYPITEAATNPDSYKAAHDAVPGGDVLSSRVWWDK